jgi:hypothetical protein
MKGNKSRGGNFPKYISKHYLFIQNPQLMGVCGRCRLRLVFVHFARVGEADGHAGCMAVLIFTATGESSSLASRHGG